MSLEREVQGAVGALGCLEGENYEKEPDCLETIKDLVRYLRRDADTSSFKVRRQLTSLNVIQKDLIPILRTYPNDAELFESTLRLLLNLTLPLTEKNVKQTESEDASNPRSVISQRLQLIEDLKRAKHAFADEKFFAVVKEKLSSLLSLDWEKQQEEDRLLIERLLGLIRNILHIPAPAEDVLGKTQHDMTAHDRIVWIMHKTGLDEMLLDLAAAESQRDFHVPVLEIISLMLREHSPEVLASTNAVRTASERRQGQQELAVIHAQEASKKLGQLRRITGRHTSFAGAYTVYGLKGLNQEKDVVSPRPLAKPEELSFDSRKSRRKIPRNRAPATETTADLALISSTVGMGRGSALEIRRILKEFCHRFVAAAYNKFMRSIQYALERRNESADGGSRFHFWWLMRYMTAFVRHCGGGSEDDGLKWKHVEETLSVHCLHEAQTQLEECLDTIKMEKKEARQWGRRAHVILKAYGEILMMLQHMERGKDEEGIDMALELKKTIFYVMEYRDELITLLKRYSPAVFTKSYLKDLVEITHVYLKMLESHCLVYGDELKVQKKRKRRRPQNRKKGKEHLEDGMNGEEAKGSDGLTEEEKRNKMEQIWNDMADDLSTLLRDVQSDSAQLPTDVVAFDSVAEHGFDDKIVAQIRIQNALKAKELPKAVALLRCSRDIWPEETALFGQSVFSGSEDDFLLLRNVFLTELPMVPGENDGGKPATVQEQATDDNKLESDPPESEEVANKEVRDLFAGGREDDSDSENSDGKYVTSEVQFSFSQYVQRFAHSDVLKWYIVLLADFSSNTVQLNHCITKMFHRISYDLKMAPILYQARLFRTFQKLLNTPGFAKQPGANELITFARHFLAGFFAKARKNKNLFVEMLFWKGFREAYEIEYGYGSYEEKKKEKKRKTKKDKGDKSDSENDLPDVMPEEAEYRPSSPSQSKPRKRRSKKNPAADDPSQSPEATVQSKKRRQKKVDEQHQEKKRKRQKKAGGSQANEPTEDRAPSVSEWFESQGVMASPIGSSSPGSPIRAGRSRLTSSSSAHSSPKDPGSPIKERKRKALMITSDDED